MVKTISNTLYAIYSQRFKPWVIIETENKNILMVY